MRQTRRMDDVPPVTPLARRLAAGLGIPFVHTSPEEAAEIALRCFGMGVGDVRRLATERDDSFRMTGNVTADSDAADSDAAAYVLKISPPGEDSAEIELPGAAIAHASARDTTLPLQRFVTPVTPTPTHRGRTVRMLHYIPGPLLDEVDPSPANWRSVGRMLARLSSALADFEHPAADRWLAWDLGHLDQLSELLVFLPAGERRDAVAEILDEMTRSTLPALRLTPRQVVHNDLHGGNLVVDPLAPAFITGILDFGDVVRSYRAVDLAVAMSYARSSPGADTAWESAGDLAYGYGEEGELTDEESALLPQLVLGRLAQRLLLGSWLAKARPENAEYSSRNLEATWNTLISLRQAPPPGDLTR